MGNLEEAKARLQAQMAEIKRHRESVERDLASKGKIAAPKAVCSLCGSYAHVAAVMLCKKHAVDLDNKIYCIYCLSNITGYTPEELRQQYEQEQKVAK